jgi:hypothetical protein
MWQKCGRSLAILDGWRAGAGSAQARLTQELQEDLGFMIDIRSSPVRLPFTFGLCARTAAMLLTMECPIFMAVLKKLLRFHRVIHTEYNLP